jgi:hypothetical protein
MKVFLWLLVILGVLALPRIIHVAKITLEVVDDDGKPVKDALVGYSERSQRTDKNGKVSIIVNSSSGSVGGGLGREGYYDSIFHNDFYIRRYIYWRPWNKKIHVVLRPVVKPVPMYVRNRNFLFPAINKDLGFDLMMADWLPPYGTGLHRDFILRVDRIFKDSDNFDATLTLTFPNNYDGIQVIKDNHGGDFSVGSQLQLPRIAPEEGYQSKMIKRVSSGTYGFRAPQDDYNNYIFRVRSESENGKFKRAMFGKIMGDIRFGPVGGNGGFEMHYYLNPDYTRNLEFDPKRNLFSNLPQTEGVALP